MTLERVAIAMSGGVDSSTAAAILKEAGYDLVALGRESRHRRGGISAGRALLLDARAVGCRRGRGPSPDTLPRG